jgi:Fe-Mn family superoxide dismutase
MTPWSRRSFIAGASLAAGVALADADTKSPAPGPARVARLPKPLPFDPARLRGLSARLVQSHWENNYGGAVRALNAIEARLPAVLAESADAPYLYTSLKREQSLRVGSVVYHESYFAALGGDGRAPAAVRSRLAAAFGSFDAWESGFRRIGAGLAGGSGWAMLGYNRALGVLENYALGDHASGPADTTPILVMDLYEHAYQMD